MTKCFKFKISKILSFKSCRSKDSSSLPFNPVPLTFRLPPPPPPVNPSTDVTTVPQRRRSSFKVQVLTVFGCGRSSTPLDVVERKNSQSLSPPHTQRSGSTRTPTFQWESEGKWHVIAQVNEHGGEKETPARRKIGSEKENRRRSLRKQRRRGSISSTEEYEEETERESLLPSSANLSPEYSSSELSKRRRQRSKKAIEEESESSSPARLSAFMQRLMPCTTTVVVEGVAVVKKSEDPYEDFKGSMMEMIVEKKMFEVAELEELLRCFLSLNAKRHHRAIVRAFSEVWVALFAGSNGGGGRRSSSFSSVRLSDYDEC